MTTNQLRPGWGYVFAMAAAMLWGVSGPSAKYLFNAGVTPFQLVQLRLTITVVVMLAWLWLRQPRLLRIARKDIAYFAVFGIVGMGACQFTYLYAISKIHVAAAILLQYQAPFFIALHALVIQRERLSRPVWICLAAAAAGCYLVVGAYNVNLLSMNMAGIVTGLLSGVAFAWYSIHGEYGMRRYNPWTVLFYAMLFAALLWNIVHPPLGAFFRPYSPAQWGCIAYIGIFGTLLPFGLYLEAINRIRATRASITATLEPITAGLVAFAFLQETMEPLQLAGAVVVLAAIVFLQLNQEHDAKSPAAIRARTGHGDAETR